MQIKLVEDFSKNKDFDVFILPFFEAEEVKEWQGFSVSNTLFSGKKDSMYFSEQDGKTQLWVGLGKETDYQSMVLIFRRLIAKNETFFNGKVGIYVPDSCSDLQIRAIFNGLQLGVYRLNHFKKDKKSHPLAEDSFEISILNQNFNLEAAELGLKIAKAQIETFNLVDLPSNVATPSYLAQKSQEIASKYKNLKVTILDRAQAKKEGLHAFLSVAKASRNEPKFIIFEYEPEHFTHHVGLVGKGITFDTGGLNIKTQGMIHMKCDMAGGGAVIGAMQLIADADLSVKVTAIVPACENSINAEAFVPSDVIQSYAGFSIEIIDTDAEGRLVLADGISYLNKNYKPDTIIDLATLTGSSVGTFGYECGAMFSSSKKLAQDLYESGFEIGERLWELPLWDVYKSDIQSDIADVKNYSGKPIAGAISAAKFVEFFTDNHPNWAHLDIAGVSFVDNEFAKTKNASAFGVHLIFNFLNKI